MVSPVVGCCCIVSDDGNDVEDVAMGLELDSPDNVFRASRDDIVPCFPGGCARASGGKSTQETEMGPRRPTELSIGPVDVPLPTDELRGEVLCLSFDERGLSKEGGLGVGAVEGHELVFVGRVGGASERARE